MIKDLENKFFETFDIGGVFGGCVDLITWKHGGKERTEQETWEDYLSQDEGEGCIDDSESAKEEFYKIKRNTIAYFNELPQELTQKFENFDETILHYDCTIRGSSITDCPLMREIANNLDECKNDLEIERYINTLLEAFEWYFGSRRIYKLGENPDNYGEEMLKYFYTSVFNSDYVFPYSKFNKELAGDGNICISVLRYLTEVMISYAIALDILLLERGLNLLWYERERGILLLEERHRPSLLSYFGTDKLAHKYIDKAKPQIQEENGTIIPPNNNLTYDEREAVFTERALKYYEKAIKRGYMELTPTHYKWLYGGKHGKVRCGVFLLRIYCPKNTEQLPERALHKLFDIERLDSTITGFINTNKKQRWLPSIDEMFDD